MAWLGGWSQAPLHRSNSCRELVTLRNVKRNKAQGDGCESIALSLNQTQVFSRVPGGLTTDKPHPSHLEH